MSKFDDDVGGVSTFGVRWYWWGVDLTLWRIAGFSPLVIQGTDFSFGV